MIDDEYIKVKRALANAAMPGKWFMTADTCIVYDLEECQVADCYDNRIVVDAQCLADATFIADARTTVPELLDEVERLRARVLDLECDIDNMRYEATGDDL
jgi:hypothetical protein